jgi:hypothetical protein
VPQGGGEEVGEREGELATWRSFRDLLVVLEEPVDLLEIPGSLGEQPGLPDDSDMLKQRPGFLQHI